MNNYLKILTLMIFAIALNLTGCTGSKSFGIAARAGDTIAVMPGRHPDLSRADISLNIIDSEGTLIVVPGNDPSIRAYFHAFPDPLSKVIVGYETNQDIDGGEISSGQYIQGATLYDKEWMQDTLILDLPTSLATGMAVIQVNIYNADTASWETIASPLFEILPGTGEQNTFQNTQIGALTEQELRAMERANHYTVSFSGTTIPYAVEINMTHNADVDNGGAGRAYVVNPRGDIKNISWSDDGSNLTALVSPARNQILSEMKDFKFYVAGEITGLALVNAQGYDIDGNQIAVTVTVE
ncbi:MAG: hypothetical protein OEW89_01710 [Gammaproteobacteria bacterium]|nr:hypothetical protein [Gammaproteobacteria bacterium]MDH5592941.1 hypothetical protein [Gammaproteobacteria bacterium]